MQEHRLKRELGKIQSHPPQGICLYYKEDSTNMLEAKIEGPPDSPYKDGVFTLELTISKKYPFIPPAIRFKTRIYHPNIDDAGRICLDLIKMPPSGNWRPTIGLEGLLIAIRTLIEEPNVDDPLMVDIANQYKNDPDEFKKKAEEYTRRYAK